MLSFRKRAGNLFRIYSAVGVYLRNSMHSIHSGHVYEYADIAITNI